MSTEDTVAGKTTFSIISKFQETRDGKNPYTQEVETNIILRAKFCYIILGFISEPDALHPEILMAFSSTQANAETLCQ
jgi:hypothetical protein